MPTDIGIIDLGMGFPYQSVEEKKAAYDFFRPLLHDRQSREQFEFPAEYMFKDAPDVIAPDVDPVAWTVDKMDEFGIEQAMVGMTGHGVRAKRGASGSLPPHVLGRPEPGRRDAPRPDGGEGRARHRVGDVLPVGARSPRSPSTTRRCTRSTPKCVELDIPICINGGIVGPRMPSWPQHVERFDNVLYDFPELTMVMMHGGEPWTALAVKLMVKWPGLHYMTSAFAPKHYPKDIIDYANSRGADKIMYCGYFPAGLTLERQIARAARTCRSRTTSGRSSCARTPSGCSASPTRPVPRVPPLPT